MIEQGQRMLKRTVRRSRQLSAESIANDLQTSCGLKRASWNEFPWPSSWSDTFLSANLMDVSGFGGCQN
ncbi:unnamed protein product, partial [Staurois parvus]